MGVFSLSHVALPFPPDDPLYGRTPPDEKGRLFLGVRKIGRATLHEGGNSLPRV